jgi:hypothetical protein
MTVAQLDNSYTLVTDSQEIATVAEHLNEDLSDYGCLFVQMIDGDYGKIYGCTYSTPWITATVYRIR